MLFLGAYLILENIKRAEVSNFDILDPLLRVLLKKASPLQLPLQRAHKNGRGGRSDKKCKKSSFTIERIQKYRKCPALRTSV